MPSFNSLTLADTKISSLRFVVAELLHSLGSCALCYTEVIVSRRWNMHKHPLKSFHVYVILTLVGIYKTLTLSLKHQSWLRDFLGQCLFPSFIHSRPHNFSISAYVIVTLVYIKHFHSILNTSHGLGISQVCLFPSSRHKRPLNVYASVCRCNACMSIYIKHFHSVLTTSHGLGISYVFVPIVHTQTSLSSSLFVCMSL